MYFNQHRVRNRAAAVISLGIQSWMPGVRMDHDYFEAQTDSERDAAAAFNAQQIAMEQQTQDSEGE